MFFIGLYLIKLHSYVLFHSLVEMFSVIIAVGIFVLAWNARRYLENGYFLFVGIAFLFIGATDLIHALAYKGMGVFPEYDANLPTQLWIAARYLQGLSFLAAPFFLDRRLKTPLVVLSGGTAVLTLLFLSIFFWNIFPACFVEGSGLTPFKVVSEYVITLLLLASIPLLLKKKEHLDAQVRKLIIASILVTVASEMSFTLYQDVYGFFNALGHFLKVIAFFLIYKAVIVTGFKRPFDLLFRDLKTRQDELHESEERYRSLFESMLNGMAHCRMVFDGEGRPVDFIYLSVNKAFEQLTGLKDVAGKSVTGVIPFIREQNPELLETYGRVAVTGKSEEIELWLKPLDMWLHILVYSQQKGYFVALFENITVRKKAEEALKESESQIRLLLNSTAEAIYGIDLQGRCTFANPSCIRILGYADVAQLLGKNMHNLIHHSYRAGSPMEFAEYARRSTRGRAYMLTMKFYGRLTAQAFRWNTGRILRRRTAKLLVWWLRLSISPSAGRMSRRLCIW